MLTFDDDRHNLLFLLSLAPLGMGCPGGDDGPSTGSGSSGSSSSSGTTAMTTAPATGSTTSGGGGTSSTTGADGTTGTTDDGRVFAHLHRVQELADAGPVVNVIEIMGCCEEAASGLVADPR